MEFKKFALMLSDRFDELAKNASTMYSGNVNKDDMWEHYLASFPEGSNPVYMTNTEHDCNTCKHFIRMIGHCVFIVNEEIHTIWEIPGMPENDVYSIVAKSMDEYVRAIPINTVMYFAERRIGCVTNTGVKGKNNNVVRFDHFHLEIPQNLIKNDPNECISLANSGRTVLKNGFERITKSALEAVLDLIGDNNLYRGTENLNAVKAYAKLREEYSALSEDKEELWLWEKCAELDTGTLRFSNTSIGELLKDISSGTPIETAVHKYESMVAPSNYKRPKAIFTKKMLEDAQKKLAQDGYLGSIPRRYAKLDDITVANTLFVDRNVKNAMLDKGSILSVFDEMKSEVTTVKKESLRGTKVSIDTFEKDILPQASTMELYLENRFKPNLVSLIAPQNPDAKPIFKWNNLFSWAYEGNVTDSEIKENVKKAGGCVDADLRFSIQWNSNPEHWEQSDMDAHCHLPYYNGHIFYANKTNNRTKGMLDIDIISPKQGVPAVENIFWSSKKTLIPGNYEFGVNCFSYGTGGNAVTAEIEMNGEIYNFKLPVNFHGYVVVATVQVDKNGNMTLIPHLNAVGSTQTRKMWEVNTQQFVPVSIMMNSPNYWDGEKGVGAKHTFFMLKGCLNPSNPNPFFNEFLCSDLVSKHKRIMEALASRTQVVGAEEQLSGVGFAHTKRNEVILRVNGNQIYEVTF